MSHAQSHSATNGASLEDCHANFFALTDVCGIKWVVYREEESRLTSRASSSGDAGGGSGSSGGSVCGEDAVLSSFRKCLESELLAVWRRVPKGALVTYTYDMSGQQVPQPSTKNNGDPRNPLSQRKELWIFWYGDKPEDQIRKLVAPSLKEIKDISGTWENGLPYEARTLLFKALNNLIERNLVSKDFVRLGKWFVAPYDGPTPASATSSHHLSFSFHYFIHGESSVCASVDVRQHPPVRRLSLHHLSVARGQASPVPVILAPYGLAGTLTGVAYRREDEARATLREWRGFYPLAGERYFCHNAHGDLVPMPAAVEVLVSGVRMVYPTCYVMVTDMDQEVQAQHKTMQTCRKIDARTHTPIYQVEPSPFTASSHPLLESSLLESNQLMSSHDSASLQHLTSRTELVWHDALCINPDAQQQQAANEEQQPGGGSQILEYLSHWDFCNPGRLTKKTPRKSNRQRDSRERPKDPRNRFTSKIPFHRKQDVVDELSWHLDQTHLLCQGPNNPGGAGSNPNSAGGQNRTGGPPSVSGQADSVNPASMGPPGSVRNEREAGALGISSPASLGTPLSVMTPKAPQPPSNGPYTPMDTSGESGKHQPRTPKSVPPPSASYSSAASPYPPVKSVEKKPEVKQEDTSASSSSEQPQGEGGQQGGGGGGSSTQPSSSSSQQLQPAEHNFFSTNRNADKDPASRHVPSLSTGPFKRPGLPMKEYEDELEKGAGILSDQIYDYQSMKHWLNHPVKKYRPAEQRGGDPLRPMYRRSSQASVFSGDFKPDQSCGEPMAVDSNPEAMVNGVQPKQEEEDEKPRRSNHLSGGERREGNNGDPYEFSDGAKDGDKRNNDEEKSTDLFTSKGLKPAMSDLDNLFDDSSDEPDVSGVGDAPTPPNSNKPAGMDDGNFDSLVDSKGKLSAVSLMGKKKLEAGNLPHDQLAKMFPTPPDNHTINDNNDNLESHPSYLKSGELLLHPHSSSSLSSSSLLTLAHLHSDLMEWTSQEEDTSVMFSSSIFSPLAKLSHEEALAMVGALGDKGRYVPRSRSQRAIGNSRDQPGQSGSSSRPSGANNQTSSSSGPNSVSSALGTPGDARGHHKPGMSPISPMPDSVGGPRSHHGPGSNYGAGGHDLASPAPKSNNPSTSGGGANTSGANASSHGGALSVDTSKAPEANALLLNLILSDSLLNIYRDHNFDSCTLCVCNNEGNVKGRDAGIYLPQATGAGDDDVSCSCGFSAVVNRRMAHQSGLFYEDETEVTNITEDLYYRKKASLLLLDPKGQHDDSNSNGFAEKSNEVDTIPLSLLEIIHKQSSFYLSGQNALAKYAEQYLRTSVPPASVSMVEMMDGNEVTFTALEHVKGVSGVQGQQQQEQKLDEALKGTCLHKWSLLPAHGPLCSEDVIRVMKCLQPLLNRSLHIKESSASTNLAVEGPLTWRQFHRMAGPATKGNTDDQCEPLPVPTVTVGHEKDFVSISPLSLHFWESLSLEPFSQPRDVVYIVVAPDNDFLMDNVRSFFKNLSGTYEQCRLGRHVPYSKVCRDGILKVGKLAANKISNGETERWFDLIGDFPTAALLKLYSQACRHYLLPMLMNMTFDRSVLDVEAQKNSDSSGSSSSKPSQSPMHHPNLGGMDGNSQSMGANSMGGMENKPAGFGVNSLDDNNKENLNGMDSPTDESEGEPPALVIYMVDPFSFGIDNVDLLRLSNLALMRCFNQILPSLPEAMRNHAYLQTISLESVVELSQAKDHDRMPSMARGLAFSVYGQTQRPMTYGKDCKSLTGFGPASNAERFLKANEPKTKFVRYLYQPSFVLAPPMSKKKSSDADSFGSSNERSSTLFVNYCLSEDQHWLIATCSDDRGELVRTNVINVEIPNKTRRKKASARRVGLRRLMDWVLSVMAMSLVPWRLVIGRIGRIGHGELRGWSVLLGRKSLKKASKQLRDSCAWPSDVPSILSACLVSIEPDSHLRLMSDQFTPDERFGQTASNCQLSTPKDASCTHVLVFPTSATAQASQRLSFEEHQAGSGANDLNDFGLPDMDLGDLGETENDIGELGDFNDIFANENFGGIGEDRPGSPGSPSGKRNDGNDRADSPGAMGGQGAGGQDHAFKYGQEEKDDRLDALQQPLALGYLVSTARTGPMPKWFWSSCPHLENVNPVFLKSALHINQASVQQGEDGFAPSSASGRVHSLDSTYTTDVLRYVLEGYNALSWLSLDPVSNDRRSCLPVHVQILQQMYTNFAALV